MRVRRVVDFLFVRAGPTWNIRVVMVRGEESYLKWRVLIEAVPRRILFGDSRAERARLFSARLFPTLWMSHADPIMLLPLIMWSSATTTLWEWRERARAASHNKTRTTHFWQNTNVALRRMNFQIWPHDLGSACNTYRNILSWAISEMLVLLFA